LTAKVAPVANAPLSEARNTTIWAISSGLPMDGVFGLPLATEAVV
jgi:hypothetical protein